MLDIGAKEVAAVAPLLRDLPDIVVGTPGRLAEHLRAGNLALAASLSILVVDEADLLFSFGFEADLRYILGQLPPIYQVPFTLALTVTITPDPHPHPHPQAVLTSATLSEDVTRLKQLVLHNPVVLKLSEPQLPDSSQLTQYVLRLEEEEKFVLVYALFKLELIRGKSLLFVSSVDRCYKVKLYLEQFNIPCCVLNSELPAATRLHTVEQFNRGVYTVIVAADERALDEGQVKEEDKAEKKEKKVDKDKDNSKRVKDKESGVARGIDFQFVANVINFDFPPDADSYVHRVGRTARGVQQGTALSLVSAAEKERLEEVEEHLREVCGGEDTLRPYQFRMEELDGFRYRARDAWRAVTKIAIREARLKEIKQEILNSQKLKSYFEDNPRDRQLLRHDKALHTVKQQQHLKNVPEYIVPETLKKMTGMKTRKGRGKKGKGVRVSDTQKKFNKRAADPLDLGVSKKRR